LPSEPPIIGGGPKLTEIVSVVSRAETSADTAATPRIFSRSRRLSIESRLEPPVLAPSTLGTMTTLPW
jgi:hypothetical protein